MMNWLMTGGHAVLSLCSGYGGLELALQRHSNGNGHGRSLYQLCGGGTLMVMEHLMGLPTGYITGLGLSTAAQRRLLGNGVAPAQGALAIWEGLNELG